jgi:hypothetical protein
MASDNQTTLPMTAARLAEIKGQAASLTYGPTRRAADELIAEVERLWTLNQTLFCALKEIRGVAHLMLLPEEEADDAG